MKRYFTALMAASLIGLAAISSAQTGENADPPTPVEQVGQTPVMAPTVTVPGVDPQVQVPQTVQIPAPPVGAATSGTIIVPSTATWGDPAPQMDRHTLDIHVYPHYGGGSVSRSPGSSRSSAGRPSNTSTTPTTTKKPSSADRPGRDSDNMTWTPLSTFLTAFLTAASILGLMTLVWLLLKRQKQTAPNDPIGIHDPGRQPTRDFDPHQEVHAEIIEEVTAQRSYRKITPAAVAAARAVAGSANNARVQAVISAMDTGNKSGGMPGWPPVPNTARPNGPDVPPAAQRVVVEHIFRTVNNQGGEGGAPRGGGKTPPNKTDKEVD